MAYSVEVTVYRVSSTPTNPDILTVHLEKDQPQVATRLVLRGVEWGVEAQVRDVRCDGVPLKEVNPGSWAVPENWRRLQWQIPLLRAETIFAGAQQSIKTDRVMMFSEASSLPRLENCGGPEVLKIALKGIHSVVPEPAPEGILLPEHSMAPLFVLLNFTQVGGLSEGLVSLRYFLDNKKAFATLPDITANMRGLQWLKTRFSSTTKENFSVGWCGIPSKEMGISGAAGTGLLLVNYPSDKSSPHDKAMLLYVALHEAFHQVSLSYGSEQPAWLGESLASYYGLRATRIALPGNPHVPLLEARFQEKGYNFAKGLLTINAAVKEGERIDYGAFYTKGILFWAAVETALQQCDDTLDRHIPALLQMTDTPDGRSLELESILPLPPKIWAWLRREFLD